MLKHRTLLLVCLFLAGLIFSESCKKDKLLTSGGSLRFSVDTLYFDTVFTTQGSFTLSMKILNPQNQKISLSSVRLSKGNSSYFHLNVDGFTGNDVKDLEIAAHDSIYVFATVNIDPRNSDNPMVVEDSLIATLNGQPFYVPFIAYGQDAHYIVDSVMNTQSWGYTDNKPYVVMHSALVDRGQTLTIKEGTRVYMHADSRLYVMGRLLAQGTKADSIIFQGDRLDRKYFGNKGYPGEWGGIYFDSSSTGNRMDWVILKNCGSATGGGFPFALEVYGKDGIANQLTISHSIIQNSFGFGLLFFNANVDVSNVLVYSTGTQALAIQQGGTYNIMNSSFVNYYPAMVAHTDQPTAVIANYYDTNSIGGYIPGNLNVVLRNTLIYGSLNDELIVLRKGNSGWNVVFDHCLLKSTQNQNLVMLDASAFTSCIFNQDPVFADYEKNDYRPKDNSSPLVGKGIQIPAITDDLDGKPRGNPPSIGCYE